MSGSGGGSTTTQKADPWIGVQPGLYNLYANAQQQFKQGGPQVYQGEGVAPMNATQNQALGSLAEISAGGYGALNPAQQQALTTGTQLAQGTTAGQQAQTGILNGSDPAAAYLRSTLGAGFTDVSKDASLQAAMDAANSNTTRNFTNTVMPGINSTFSAAGRFGSGAQNVQSGNATNNLATQISNTNAGLSFQDLQSLRAIQQANAGTLGGLTQNAASGLNSSQLAGAQLTPSLALQGTQNANAGLLAGGMQQQQAQSELSDYINRYNSNQQQPYNNLNWYANILAGGNPLASQTSTQSPQSSGLQRAGTGALSGAATGAAIGSVFPGVGTALGAGVGAIGGGLMGLL